MTIREWLRARKTVASATVLAVALAVPVTAAVIYEGFPLDDVDLMARDVWVTKGSERMAGRLNMQIRELNGGVNTGSAIEVLQDGDAVFIHDPDRDSLVRVDPSYTDLREAVELPAGSTVSYGSERLVVTSADGIVWAIDATQPLLFSPEGEPLGELGSGARSVVTTSGAVVAFSPEQGSFVKLDPLGGAPVTLATGIDVGGAFELVAVGERVVLFDVQDRTLVFDDGRVVDSESILRVQRSGPARDGVVVVTSTDLLEVGFDGSIRPALGSPGAEAPATDGSGLAAPVVVGACVYSAWATSATYFAVCDGADPVVSEIPGLAAGARLEFRVNRSVVALNDTATGRSWLALDELVETRDNWDEVTPPTDDESEEVDDTVTQQSLSETLATRTLENNAPEAVADSLGARPGTTTILPVLDNDSDVDGDVLTITEVSDIGDAGALTIIEGGRALQIAPGAGISGTVSFRYTVSDGRAGGTAEAPVDVAVRPLSLNEPPVLGRSVSVDVGAGQTRTYNVLRDWTDPDGDELYVTGAQSTTGDTVQFLPQGDITFINDVSVEPGPKSVLVTVSDGTVTSAPAEILFDVTVGDLLPIPTPDHVTEFVGDRAELSPLDNDIPLAGTALRFTKVEALEGAENSIEVGYDLETGVVRLRGYEPGTYYLTYALDERDPARADDDVKGIIRFDVIENPDDPSPPIAVKDTGYLRPDGAVTVPVLLNDLSPSGAVLGIQNYVLPPGSPLSVEILGGTVLRVSSTQALTEQSSFEYTVSDGVSTSTTGVTIVPVPELSKHRAPLAKDDAVTVRTGDIASVAVLDNDYHPDGARMVLDPVLVEGDIPGGVAFVNGDRVRIQAPSEPGQFVLTYRVTDAFEEAATARVVVTVVEGDPENNQPPVPRTLEARVFEGGSVPIEIPLDGIDPDGDSVEFTGASGAAKGTISAVGATSFTYTALAGSRGTDTFFYRVRDALGAVESGVIRVGVIPRATEFAPSAQLDEVTLRPGRTAEIPVLANDSDPNGYTISLDPELVEVDSALDLEVDGDLVVLRAPEEEGTYRFAYRITSEATGADGEPLASQAVVTVVVDPDAVVLPPVAIDQAIDSDEVAGTRSTVVDVFDGASNPGGRTSDLVVEVTGVGSDTLTVGAGGRVTVPIGDERRVYAYSLTNEEDGLTTSAFIIAPRYVDAPPPRLKPEWEENPPQLAMNQSGTWTLDELLDVPSGRPAILADVKVSVAPSGAGVAEAIDDDGISFEPVQDYRGPAALTFTVTDGASPDDDNGNVAVITLPIIVGDSTFEDVDPTFTNTRLELEPGESTSVDLRALSDHPNPDVRSRLSFSDLQITSRTSAVEFSLAGDRLDVAVDQQDSTGATAQATFTVSFDGAAGVRSVTGTIDVTVISSRRPLPQAVDDVEPEGRSSTRYTPDVLANDFNPFAADGDPLEILVARFEGDALGATLQSTASGITVTTGTAKAGTITVVYEIGDVTNDPNRRSSARYTLIVASAPEPVTNIALGNPGSQTVSVVYQPPTSSNGAEITGYVVRIDGPGGTAELTDCLPGATCTFTGRTNGQSQSVTVAATNKVGTTPSAASTITPFGTPSVPTNQDLRTNSSTATATLTPVWSGPSDNGGGQLTYNWRYTDGAGDGATPGTTGGTRNVGAGTYGFEVQACNPGGCSTWVGDTVTITAPPPRMWVTQSGNTVTWHWANFPSGFESDYDVRVWRWGKSTHPNGFAANYCSSSEGGSIMHVDLSAGGSGSASLTCSQPAADTYSVEPYGSGPIYLPRLNVGESWTG